jgi:cytochrome b involved in lipid metabolism
MRAAAATPGEHLGVAREALLERQVGAQGRVAQLFDRILGSSDAEAVKAQHLEKLADAGTRAYGTAFANERPFNLAPIFMQWKVQFDKMRGVIPDTVRARLDKMMWTETLADGRTAQVPPQTLEAFMYAREGLRDLIGELPQGNNLRRHLTKLYGEMTDEVAKTNPAWKTANDIWRDGQAGTEALQAGVNMSTRLGAKSRENLAVLVKAEEDAANATKQLLTATQAVRGKNARRAPTAEEMEKATPAQRFAVEQAQARLDAAEAKQKLFKHGLASSLYDMLMNQGETHDVSKKLLLPGAQKLLRRALGDDAEQVFNVLRAEAAMGRTYKSQFGAQTTPLAEAVKEQTWAPRFEASMLNPLTWLNPAIRFMHEHAARTINARRNKELMGLYTETDPLKQMEMLRAMQSLHQVRSQAGNIAGKPVVGIGSGAFPDAVIGSQSQSQPAPIGVRRP